MATAGLLNGQAVMPELALDRGFQFGDGLFETIAITDGCPCEWDGHYFRLKKGAALLAIPVPDEQLLFAEVCELAAGHRRAVVKLILTAGQADRGYARSTQAQATRWLQLSAWPSIPLYQSEAPVRLGLSDVRLGSQPLLGGLKHLNRLEQVLAKAQLPSYEDEAVMLDQQNHVVEGIMSNVLLQDSSGWATPEITDCGVAGVVRQRLLDDFCAAGEPVEVTTMSIERLKQAEQLFVMNSLIGVRPVSQFLGQHYRHDMPERLQIINRRCFEPVRSIT